MQNYFFTLFEEENMKFLGKIQVIDNLLENNDS